MGAAQPPRLLIPVTRRPPRHPAGEAVLGHEPREADGHRGVERAPRVSDEHRPRVGVILRRER
ncbi:hypothetical protein [Lentzea sp. NPDC003310]|uniref:hypothetical protein n=1 Tax=Lentzea sp. NPDC003310 TaxID=3154447 RepID=UPI0033B16260